MKERKTICVVSFTLVGSGHNNCHFSYIKAHQIHEILPFAHDKYMKYFVCSKKGSISILNVESDPFVSQMVTVCVFFD